jgi:hypothetical protein
VPDLDGSTGEASAMSAPMGCWRLRATVCADWFWLEIDTFVGAACFSWVKGQVIRVALDLARGFIVTGLGR